jgi:hypothetical protein
VLYGPDFVAYAASARIFAISIVVLSCGVGPILTLTATRRVVPLFVVQLARLVVSVGLTVVFASAWGVTGAATANLVTAAVSVVAMWIIQSRVRRSVEGAQPLPEVQLETEDDEVKMLLETLEGELKKLLDNVDGRVDEAP